MWRRRSLVALAAGLALALPAGALGQSAGDDQYQDPFSGQPTEGSQGGGGNGAGGGGDGGNATQTAQPSPAPEAEAATATQAQGAAQDGATLPRSGAPALLLLGCGWALLVGGVALRRVN